MGKENLNPFSGKGTLTFGSFFWSLVGAIVVNLILYAFIRAGLISARAAFDKDRMMAIYAGWFISASIGFTVIANTFIKRWASILDQDIGKIMKALFRFALLSPLLAIPMTAVTVFFFPRGPLNDVGDGGSKIGIIGILAGASAVTILLSAFIPNSFFGLERIDFRNSTEPFVSPEFNNGKNPMPTESTAKPVLASVTPALRYLAWLGSDLVRTRMLSAAIDSDPKKICSERLGFMKVEVQDCYFNNLRKMAIQVPMVAPYFALYFETEYRKRTAEALAQNTQAAPVERFASSILMISNLLELLEPGPMFIERAHLLKPSFMLHAYASPEIVLVEGGQDLQRMTIVNKLLPIIDTQIEAIQKMLKEVGSELGSDEVTVQSEMRDIGVRVQAVRKDPLMLGVYAH